MARKKVNNESIEQEVVGDPLAIVRVTYKDGTHIEVANVLQPYIQEKQGCLIFPVYGYGMITISLVGHRMYEIAAMRGDGQMFRPVQEHFEGPPTAKHPVGFRFNTVTQESE